MDGGVERPGWGGALAVGVAAVALAVTPNLVNAVIDGDTPVRPGTTVPVGPFRYDPAPGWVEDRAASSYGQRSVVRRGAVTVTVESVPPGAADQAGQDATTVVRMREPPAAVAVTVTAPPPHRPGHRPRGRAHGRLDPPPTLRRPVRPGSRTRCLATRSPVTGTPIPGTPAPGRLASRECPPMTTTALP